MTLDTATAVRLAEARCVRLEVEEASDKAQDNAYAVWRVLNTKKSVNEVNALLENVDEVSRDTLVQHIGEALNPHNPEIPYYLYLDNRTRCVEHILDGLESKQAPPPYHGEEVYGYDKMSLRLTLMGVAALNRELADTDEVQRVWAVLEEFCPVRDADEGTLSTPYRLYADSMTAKPESEKPTFHISFAYFADADVSQDRKSVV